jgi:hypothetical protein
MPDGEMRRPPQLWEEKLARTTSVLGVGISSGGDATSIVGTTPTPGSDGGVEPAPVLPPPGAFIKPSTPTLVGSVQGIRVTWDGLNADGELWPYDTSWIEVHMDTSGTAFTPGSATLKGRLDYPGEFFVGGLTAGTTYFFKLRGVDPADNVTEPSDAASGQTGLTTSSDYGTATIGSGAVSFNARQIGGVTNTVGSTAPTSPLLNDVWLDSSPGTAIVHRIWNGSSWVANAWGSASIAAGQVTALQVAAGAITAGAIAAGAVTADKITADAIDGKTITGATFRTSASGARVVFDTSGIKGFDATSTERFTLNASTGDATVTGRFRTKPSGARIEISNDVTFADSIIFRDGSDVARVVLQLLASKLFVSGATDFADAVGASSFTATGGVTGSTVTSTGGMIGQTLNISGATVDMAGVHANNTTGIDTVGITGSPNFRLRRISSSQEIKYDITPLSGILSDSVDEDRLSDVATVDPSAVLDLAVTEFSVIDGAEPTDRRVLGFIADDVADKLPVAVTRYDDGRPAGVLDTSILAAVVAVVQDQAQQIQDLRARIEALEA